MWSDDDTRPEKTASSFEWRGENVQQTGRWPRVVVDVVVTVDTPEGVLDDEKKPKKSWVCECGR